MSHHILVVDDDPHIREVICFALEKAGMRVASAQDGAEAMAQFERAPADLIVLDIGMPEMDGLEVCRQLRRRSDVPILFLSARSDEIDRVLGLELGGDDYVTKPFSPRELVVRVNTILKRAKNGADTKAPTEGVLARDALRLDPDRFDVSFANKQVQLTALEFSILRMLAARPGVVFSRDRIMDSAYSGNVHVSDRTIDSHIRNIRGKFAAVGCASVIDTVHGVGFRLGDVKAAG
ncbi:MAG: response regulator transcription factor [Terricaulis sp.]